MKTCGVLALLVIIASVLPCAAQDAANMIRNGDFEESDGAALQFWHWGISNDAKAQMQIDRDTFKSGTASVRLHSETPESPHVYGGISQEVAVRPRMKYRLSAWVKGRDAGKTWMGGGPGWLTRIQAPRGTFDWQQISCEFVTGPDESTWHLRINIDAITDSIWVDDIRIEEIGANIQNGVITRISKEDFVRSKMAVVTILANVKMKIDGDLSEWPAFATTALRFPQKENNIALENYAGNDDLSFVLRMAATQAGLVLAVEVTDDKFVSPVDSDGIWKYDSIQIAIDSDCSRCESGYDSDDREFDFGLANGRPVKGCNNPGGEAGRKMVEKVVFAAKNIGTTINYEILIPWDALELQPHQAIDGRAIGFNILVNDHDGDDRGYIEWTKGIGRSKCPREFAKLVFLEGGSGIPALRIFPEKEFVDDNDVVEGSLLIASPLQPVKIKISVSTEGASIEKILAPTEITADSPLLTISYGIPSDAIPEGDYQIIAVAEGQTLRVESLTPLVRKNTRVHLMEAHGKMEAELKRLEGVLTDAEKQKFPVAYPKLALRTVKLFLPFIQDDIRVGNIMRAESQTEGCRKLLEKAAKQLDDGLSGKKLLPATPRYVTGKLRRERFHYVADTEEPASGRRERRPVFFNGYGHFSTARKMIPDFPDLGANIIQIESGPNSCLFEKDSAPDTTRFREYIVSGLDEAAKNNVMIIPLLSPHYFPDWAYKEWPEIGRADGGFIKFTVEHPAAMRIIETYIRAVGPLMKGHPALHSVCLSNEPIYRDTRNDPFTQKGWSRFLSEKYSTVANLNKTWGTEYPSFNLIPIPEPKFPDDITRRGIYYDWCLFNNARFAAWHSWMRGVVKDIAPETDCHAKVMDTHFSRSCLSFGTDAELFAHMGDVNGNDCPSMYDHNSWSEFSTGQIGMNRYHDLQCSFLEAPIVDTENHIIRDRDTAEIPPEHIYAALWQGALHGQGASAVWVWERTNDPESDFCGSILHRPLCVDAAGRAHFDMMRLSHEMVALQDLPKRVGILYSIAAMVQDDAYLPTISDAYEALSFSGEPIRFISEKQLGQREFSDLKLIILPNAGHVRPEILPALKEFAQKGRVVALGVGNLTGDPYRRPFAKENTTGIVSARIQGWDNTGKLLDPLNEQISRAGIKRDVELVVEGSNTSWGVEWRAAKRDGKWVVNVFNLLRKPVKVRLTTGGKDSDTFTDRITEDTVGNPADIAPMQVRLLEFKAD
ncbi:MAG TPA: beta-galactosidase [Candidatus Brocadiia bacterium]|nr:beta-galactosidase [Candidatus Brocadiia bacterium]